MEAIFQFKEIWKTKKRKPNTPQYGAPEREQFDQAQAAYRELALDAAGFPMWYHGHIGSAKLANKTEAEELVRTELEIAPGDPIDFP